MIFADMNVAAHAALQEAAQCSQNKRECGGIIIERSGEFIYTAPRPGRSFGVSLEADYGAAWAAGEHVVADYHVHICSPHNRVFSPFFSTADALLNDGLHTIGYMLSLCDGNIRRYDPTQDDRDDEEVDFHSGKKLYLTIGHVTGFDLKTWLESRRI